MAAKQRKLDPHTTPIVRGKVKQQKNAEDGRATQAERRTQRKTKKQ